MEDNVVSQGQVLRAIDQAKSEVGKNISVFSDNMYKAMDYFASLILDKNMKGGSDATFDPVQDGIHFFQNGGEFPIRLGPSSSLVKPLDMSYLDNISLDGAYKKVKETIHSIDEKNREIASVVGPVVFINNNKHLFGVGPIPPYLPVRLEMPSNAVLPFITYFLESLRLVALSGPYKSDLLRKILSIVLAILDITSGEWKNGVLSILGLFGTYPLLFGFMGRIVRQVWNFVSPDLQNRLEDDVFAASKSLVAGLWLSMFTTFAPNDLHATIQSILDKLKAPAEQFNTKLAAIEREMQASAAKIGLQVQLPKIPLSEIPSMDDLQSLQSILRRPEVVCNPQVRQVIQPLFQSPATRLLLELFNIPSSDEAFGEICKGQTVNVADSFKPVITPL
jgi:hypothetical protein